MEQCNKFKVMLADCQMQAIVRLVGQDLAVEITGGEHPHIGSVSVLTKNQPLQTYNFPSHNGRCHKDDLISENIAAILQSSLPGNCAITAGVHVDGITKKQIAASQTMSRKLGEEIEDWLQKQSLSFTEPRYYKSGERPSDQ